MGRDTMYGAWEMTQDPEMVRCSLLSLTSPYPAKRVWRHNTSMLSTSTMALTQSKLLAMFSFTLLLAPSALSAALTYGRLMLHLPNFWPDGFEQATLSVDDDVKVPVTLGVMSRCPDALICEATFDKVVPQVEDKIDLSLSFIGR